MTSLRVWDLRTAFGVHSSAIIGARLSPSTATALLTFSSCPSPRNVYHHPLGSNADAPFTPTKAASILMSAVTSGRGGFERDLEEKLGQMIRSLALPPSGSLRCARLRARLVCGHLRPRLRFRCLLRPEVEAQTRKATSPYGSAYNKQPNDLRVDLRNPQAVNSTLLQPGLNPRLPALVLALGIKAIKGYQRGEIDRVSSDSATNRDFGCCKT
jgi:hypothetical protein